MDETELERLRYPIGRFQPTGRLTPPERDRALAVLEGAPAALRVAIEGLQDPQLDTPYREGGWTVRQVVHHLADSHLNGYVRTRWTLTESEPTIKAYEQDAWAELGDARQAALEPSLALLEGLHVRWVALFRGLAEQDHARRFSHPEGWRGTIDTLLALYTWHSHHHTAHVTGLRERNGW